MHLCRAPELGCGLAKGAQGWNRTVSLFGDDSVTFQESKVGHRCPTRYDRSFPESHCKTLQPSGITNELLF